MLSSLEWVVAVFFDTRFGCQRLYFSVTTMHGHEDSTAGRFVSIADLLLIADSLSDAGIPHLLIRHSHAVPGLVVDLAHRDRAIAALADRAVTEPLYAKPKGGTPVPRPRSAP